MPSVDSSAWSRGRRMRKSGPKMSSARDLVGAASGLQQPDLEHLARVVPLVHRGVDVEALVALQPDQPRAEAAREHLGELGLADARLALEQQRPLELEREEHRGRDRSVGDVAALAERFLHRLGRPQRGARSRRARWFVLRWWPVGRHGCPRVHDATAAIARRPRPIRQAPIHARPSASATSRPAPALASPLVPLQMAGFELIAVKRNCFAKRRNPCALLQPVPESSNPELRLRPVERPGSLR